MKKLLGEILQWVLLGVLFLGIPSALADPIQSMVGVAGCERDTRPCTFWVHTEVGHTDYLGVPADRDTFFTEAKDNHGLLTFNLPYLFNQATLSWQPQRTVAGNNLTLGLPAVGAYISNGTNWDQMRSVSTTDDSTGGGITYVGGALFDGTNWDRARSGHADSVTVGLTGAQAYLAVSGTTASRLFAASASTDGSNGQTIGAFSPQLFNGTTWDRGRSASASTLTATTSLGTQLTAPLSTWSATNTPATATQATASRAAGAAGVRHVATTITACLAAEVTLQTPILVNLRDGATGAGTILRSWAIAVLAGDSKCVDLSGLAMIGTAATAMTIEFAAAGAAATQQTVTLTGFSTQ